MTALINAFGPDANPGAHLRLSPQTLSRLMPMHLVLDADGVITDAGPTILQILDEPGETALGRQLFDLVDVRRPPSAETVAQLLQAPGGRVKFLPRSDHGIPLKGLAVPLPHGAGALVNLSLGISVLDAVQAMSLTSSDFAHTDLTIDLLFLHEANSAAMAVAKRLTQRLQTAHAAAEQKALTDALTGLKNRRAMDRFLERIVEEGSDFTLLHLDLDKFKAVNDTYGHAAGDEVLQVVGARLSSQVRGSDVVGRIGGDEFVIVVRNTTRPEQLTPMAKRIITGLEKPIPFGGVDLSISCSIGIAPSTHYDLPNREKMLHDADMALYRSKHDGRGRHSYVHELEDADEPDRDPG